MRLSITGFRWLYKLTLKALGISRYHLNATCGCKRYTCRSYSLLSVVYSWKQSGSECTMGIGEIQILLSQPLIGHMRLKVLRISRYHVNERREYERYTYRSYSISAVAYCWKQSDPKDITSMYNGNQRDMHTDFKASLRSYTIESTRDLKVSPQCAIKI